MFFFNHYLGTWSNLTNIFEMGWNHQLEKDRKGGLVLVIAQRLVFKDDVSLQQSRCPCKVDSPRALLKV